jgi:hypothetical protein
MKNRLPHLSPIEEAERFARVMIESSKNVSVPELMVMYATQITAERDMWSKAAEDLSMLQTPPPGMIDKHLWKQMNSIQDLAEACITTAKGGTHEPK